MRPRSHPEWWRLRRVLWPLGAFALLTLALAIAVSRSGDSRVVVYNETGRVIHELAVSACGQSQTFQDVRHHESVRLSIRPQGEASDLAITTNGVVAWRGEYLEPRGGYRAIVHLRRDGQVEVSTTISWWQQFLRPAALQNL